jgi:site-specific recombinase XerD
MKKQSLNIPLLIQRFFGEHLPQQRNCSPNTIASYADSFRLFLEYMLKVHRVVPSRITLADISSQNVLAFLNHLEKDRKNGIATRNSRLAAIRSFLHYLLILNPTLAGNVQGVMHIPLKRKKRKVLEYLTRVEVDAIIDATSKDTWSGRRDKAMFQLMYNTGARVSEIINLKVSDLRIESKGIIHFLGKGRKERHMPLWKNTVTMLRQWIKANRYTDDSPLFLSNRNQKLSRSAVTKRLECAVKKATQHCPTLKKRHVSPHTIRHTTAMHLLQNGIDITVIAMWLGHESIETTHVYIDADMTMKTKALASLQEPSRKNPLFKASDSLLAYLDNL